MTELNCFIVNKSLNNGYIYFDSSKKAKECREILKKNNVRFVTYVVTNGENSYYGFRVFRMKRQILELCEDLISVLGE